MSPPFRLCAFGLLLVAIFLGARAAGSSLGPVTATYVPAGTGPGPADRGTGGSMNMGPRPAGAGTRAPRHVRAAPARQAGREGR